MKIGFRITLLMVVLNVVSIGVIGTVLIFRAWATAGHLADNLTMVRARQIGEEFDNFLENHWYTVKMTAAIMGQFESIPVAGRREFMNNSIRGMVETGQFIANAWSIWDPDVLEGNDQAWIGTLGSDEEGRFVPGYTRNLAGDITDHIRRDFEGDEFYLLPKRLGTQIITNPYNRILAGEVRNIATMAAPIRNTANQIVGVVGLDISLSQLNVMAQDIERIFPGTLTAAFSNNGTIISHFDEARIGRNIHETEGDLLGTYLIPFSMAIAQGRTAQFDIRAGRDVFRFYAVPIPISDFSETWTFAIAIPLSEVHENTYMMITFAIIICVIMLALVIIAALFVSRSVARPIVNMATILNDIASGEGDLTVRLPETGSGETADASRYFNMTIEKIKELISSIKNQARELSEIGNELASNMTETASAMNQITANIQGIKSRVVNQSASVTESNATMEQVTVNIGKLNTHVEQQANTVSQASSAIEQMMANIQSVTATLVKNVDSVRNLQLSSETGRSSLQGVAQDIQEIARESEGLMEINAVIENIASQTNLLSMNAAIEAAHAGEAGRGFAVVADEIRKLAESSGEQSKTIGTVLKKIKESIDKITRSTGAVLDKFEAIDQGVRTVADQEETIRDAMEEQAQGSKQVLNASRQVSDITQQVKGGSMEMLDGSKEVIHESKNLERVTLEITNGINEMAVGAEQVNRAVNSVNELSNRNRENISLLVRAISQFKI
ncbi:MAG: methyl-accepting chemotaxis protein [Treponema sp.]|nr:methyl-accepting chemotaxis protein [Treponema sp.]